ncbi:STAS/SEC14 domain-containing protein [Sphingomonas psychrotolerans]|uniref:STAS/SEC14 domain-containing protein n=1 Tax=Sphingomonas psychrotolerans TaxID=1327635 RepID=A0ABU3N7P8_9SPHN|nr:hypothetical protein [Sphingomonas psychrotolerans]MDT8760341.1 STAS/SEC14 domain-containing protein [Sphingomonas psychrotolerans]
MSATFSINAEPGRDLVRIAMAGLFTPEDIEAFYKARESEHAKLTCGPNRHLTINDLRGMKIQPQESVAAFQQMLGAPEYRSRRLAFVIGQTLARGQLQRALGGRGPDVRCFDTVAEAEAWLFSGAVAGDLRAAG